MINSRRIEDLHPRVAKLCSAFLAACKAQGIDVLVYCTYRDNEAQAAVYAQGRTTPGQIVTNAKPGDSAHQYRVAFDWVPLIGGKPQWNNAALYLQCGKLAESVGLEWAGRWQSFKEQAHCQFTGGLTMAQLKAGAQLPAA